MPVPVNLSVSDLLANSVRLNWVAGVDSLQALINSLFSASEQGAIYIPKPIVNGAQALFQDSAGTVPVTADGDPVGRMLDQSGNGNHVTQSVSGSRPVYRTDGTLHWLETNGVNQFLSGNAFVWAISLTTGVSVSVGMEALPQSDNRLIGEGSSSSISPIYSPVQSDRVSTVQLVSFGRDDDQIVFIDYFDTSAGNAFNGSAHVSTHKNFSSVVTNLVDGVQVASFSYSNSTLTLDTFAIGALVRTSPISFYEGKIFGSVISEASNTTEQDSYLAPLSGVTL